MDYEKKYNEALERAKAAIDIAADKDLVKGVAITIFPELRESEDERIRKELIAFFQDDLRGDYWHDLEVGHILAWLEKQKEQKPAEWDDYTKTNLGRALQIIKNAKGNLQGYQSDDGIYECDKAIECLEHFLYRGLEIEKPAEWSEEDELMRTVIIQTLEKFGGRGTTEIQIDWLKSLRPVSKESLQPHWKPSEEQMKMLAMFSSLRCASRQEAATLESLYNDLKRLM